MKNSHSPLPWSLSQRVQNQLVVLADNGTSNVCMVFGSLLSQDPENPINAVQTANAALIVRAVNSHQALVDACRSAMADMSDMQGVRLEEACPVTFERLRAALAIATK